MILFLFPGHIDLFYPFMLNVFSHRYQMNESISNFGVVGSYFYFYSIFFYISNSCLQTMENLIRIRSVKCKVPKYRLPSQINFNKCSEEIAGSLQEFVIDGASESILILML